MKHITSDEQKQILLNMLDYIHKTCIKHGIHYSLIGGSLIGAVREKGIIPWDDDVDIILLKKDYDKLISVLRENNSKYKILTHEIQSDYYYPFAKLVDQDTVLHEKNLKEIENYGVFLDIFCYNFITDNHFFQKLYYLKLKFLKQLITGYAYDKNVTTLSFLKKIRNSISNLLGIDFILKVYENHTTKYNKKDSNYLLSNWSVYGIDKDMQCKNHFENFEVVKFDGIDAMISSSYDALLTKTFGNYMVRPPLEKQKTAHSFEMFWK